jgi:hypothetical protein
MGAMLLRIVCVAFWVAQIAAQGLVLVPATLNRELGNYWLRKLGDSPSYDYYSTMYQRNAAPGANVFAQLNNISAKESPVEAINKLSCIRGLYLMRGVGGTIRVQSFYKLLRCEDDSCFTTSKVAVASGNSSTLETEHLLVLVKARMGQSDWLVNAHQSVVTNEYLAKSEEQTYVDDIYKLQFFYKVVMNPSPCSASTIQTLAGSVAEFYNLPGFLCITFGTTPLILGTDSPSISTSFKQFAVPWNHCDGSLGLLYSTDVTSGPRILRFIKDPGEVPLGIILILPPNTEPCEALYATPDQTLQAAQFLFNAEFNKTVTFGLPLLPEVTALGFSGICAPVLFASGYGFTFAKQAQVLVDSINNQAVVDAFLPYNGSCVAMLGVVKPVFGDISSDVDRCAQLFYGTKAQQTEAVVTYNYLDPNAQPTDLEISSLQSQCDDPANVRYKLPIQSVLPQVALDFEEAKNLLVSAIEVSVQGPLLRLQF